MTREKSQFRLAAARAFTARAAMRSAAAGAALASVLATGPAHAIDLPDSIKSIFGGGGEKYETKILPDIPADNIYDQGLARLEKKDYEGAGKKFGELEKQYPYSGWSRKGLLMQTYSQYTEGKYDDAVGTANRYIGLYPSSPDTPYVYYLAGMSYYNQIPEADRDQERAEKAVAVFTQLVQKFPKSEYSNDARYKIQVAKDQIAAREMKVGRFYLQEKNYTAGINRFREVVGKYQDTRHAEEALYRLVEGYLRLGVVSEAQTAAAVLGHNYPDSSWYQEAYKRLQSNGLEPQEDKGSWISRSFRKVVG